MPTLYRRWMAAAATAATAVVVVVASAAAPAAAQEPFLKDGRLNLFTWTLLPEVSDEWAQLDLSKWRNLSERWYVLCRRGVRGGRGGSLGGTADGGEGGWRAQWWERKAEGGGALGAEECDGRGIWGSRQNGGGEQCERGIDRAGRCGGRGPTAPAPQCHLGEPTG